MQSRLLAWSSRRQQRSLEAWEQIRAKGKARFVLRTTLTYGLTLVGAADIIEHLSSGGSFSISLGWLILLVLFGILMGSSAWTKRETEYQNALRETRVKASPSGELPPHDSPLRITPDSQPEWPE